MSTAPDADRDRERARARERVGSARARHRERGIVVRVASAAAGFLLVAIAIVLFFLPEIALPLALVGLRLLSLEYDWAADAQAWLIVSWARLRGWFASQTMVMKFALSAALAVVLVAIIALLFGN